MVNNLHINFLREKVGDLRTALLYSNSKSVLKLPTTIVTAVNVDELGQLWLLVPHPPQSIKEFEQNFPVKLNFYRKGRDFYLNVTGRATIVLEPGELDEMIGNIDTITDQPDQWILLRVEVNTTEYHDNSMTEKHNWISSLTAQINKLITPSSGNYNPLTVH